MKYYWLNFEKACLALIECILTVSTSILTSKNWDFTRDTPIVNNKIKPLEVDMY